MEIAEKGILQKIINKTYLDMKRKRLKLDQKAEKETFRRCHSCRNLHLFEEMVSPEWYITKPKIYLCPECYQDAVMKHNAADKYKCPVCGKYTEFIKLKDLSKIKPGHKKVCEDCYEDILRLRKKA